MQLGAAVPGTHGDLSPKSSLQVVGPHYLILGNGCLGCFCFQLLGIMLLWTFVCRSDLPFFRALNPHRHTCGSTSHLCQGYCRG